LTWLDWTQIVYEEKISLSHSLFKKIFFLSRKKLKIGQWAPKNGMGSRKNAEWVEEK